MDVERIGWRTLAVLSIVALSGSAEVAPANGGSMSLVGGMPKLMQQHPAIEVTSQFVHAWISGDSTRVDCVFFMHNGGDSTTALIGFPDECSESDGAVELQPFHSFTSFVDGEPVRTSMIADTSLTPADLRARAWYLMRVPFAAHQTRCIRDVYVGNVGSSDCEDGVFAYTLFWAGSWAVIGTTDVVFSLADIDPAAEDVTSTPPAASYHGDEWRWHFDAIRPRTSRDLLAPNRIAVAWRPKGQKRAGCE